MHFDGTFGDIQVPPNVMDSNTMDPHLDNSFKWKSKKNVLQNTVIYHFHIVPISISGVMISKPNLSKRNSINM